MIKKHQARDYENSQEEIVNFLVNSDALSPGPVQHIQTHISHIFLAEDRAYKMKRAVSMNFADLRQREQRQAASMNELRLNRRTTPGLYLGWRGIYKPETELQLSELRTDIDEITHQEPLECLVVMQRFDERDLLSNRLQANDLPPHTLDALCEEVIAFHRSAEPRPDCGGFSAMLDNVGNIRTNLETFGRHHISAEQVTHWYKRVASQLQDHADLLDHRREQGFVRQCHGDLHLANAFMDGDQPRLFDCIDFSDELACIDVLYDLAFLLMDLMYNGLHAETSAVLNRYLAATRDYQATALLPLYVSIRAAIRAMVAAIEAAEKPQAQNHIRSAQAHFELAVACLRERPAAQIIAVGGYSGTGKSTLAKEIASAAPLHTFILSSDVIRKRQLGVMPEQNLPKTAYDSARSAAVYDQLAADTETLLRTKAVVIADATFLQAEGRRQLERIAEDLNTPFNGFWLDLPLETALQRTANRVYDPSDADADVLHKQRKESPGVINWVKLDASAPGLADLVLASIPLDREPT